MSALKYHVGGIYIYIGDLFVLKQMLFVFEFNKQNALHFSLKKIILILENRIGNTYLKRRPT